MEGDQPNMLLVKSFCIVNKGEFLHNIIIGVIIELDFQSVQWLDFAIKDV